MKALVTGASSGIGREIAKYLSEKGIDLIIASRDKAELEYMQKELKTNVQVVVIDLADEKRIKDLYMIVKHEKIDILVNNAGFGDFGDYKEADIKKELNMIDVNVKAVHILTRMILKDMVKKDHGYILNVASSAGLLKGGPLMSCYYATKSYVVSFTNAIYEELRRNKSNVHISCLCPGPVRTNFNKVAGVKFNVKSMDAKTVARYGVDQMFKEKLTIVPGFSNRVGLFFMRFLSTKALLKMTYKFQERKNR